MSSIVTKHWRHGGMAACHPMMHLRHALAYSDRDSHLLSSFFFLLSNSVGGPQTVLFMFVQSLRSTVSRQREEGQASEFL